MIERERASERASEGGSWRKEMTGPKTERFSHTVLLYFSLCCIMSHCVALFLTVLPCVLDC